MVTKKKKAVKEEIAKIVYVRDKPDEPVDISKLSAGDKYYEKTIGGVKILKKKPWTRPMVEEQFEKKTILPESTVDLVWQGIKYTVYEGVEVAIPSPHYEIYMELVRNAHSRPHGDLIIEGQLIHVMQGAGNRGMD